MTRVDSLPCAVVVGVVEDVARNDFNEDASMQYYVPITQKSVPSAVLVRTDEGETERLIPVVRKALQDLAPDIPFPRVRSYATIMDPQLRPWKLGATMFTLFGGLAFIVATIGLYGLLAYSVAQRRYEFGIRTALGANAWNIARLVLANGVSLVSIGLLLGLTTAAAASKWAGPLLFDVGPRGLGGIRRHRRHGARGDRASRRGARTPRGPCRSGDRAPRRVKRRPFRATDARRPVYDERRRRRASCTGLTYPAT